MTQKFIYSNFYLAAATQQLSELTENPTIQFPVGSKVQDGKRQLAICLSLLKVLEEQFQSQNFLIGGICNDFPLKWFLLFHTRACCGMMSPN